MNKLIFVALALLALLAVVHADSYTGCTSQFDRWYESCKRSYGEHKCDVAMSGFANSCFF